MRHPDFVFQGRMYHLDRAFCFRYRVVLDHNAWYADARRWPMVCPLTCIHSLEWN